MCNTVGCFEADPERGRQQSTCSFEDSLPRTASRLIHPYPQSRHSQCLQHMALSSTYLSPHASHLAGRPEALASRAWAAIMRWFSVCSHNKAEECGIYCNALLISTELRRMASDGRLEGPWAHRRSRRPQLAEKLSEGGG